MENKKALAIDGNSLLYRCFYGTYKMISYYQKKNLIPSNAIKLFINSLNKILTKQHYDFIFVAFDHGKKTFRSEKDQEYKLNRKPMPQELLIQISYLKKILDYMGIYQQSLIDYEADDLIGSYVKIMNQNNVYVDIYTSDRDLLQLVSPQTTVNLLITGISEIKTYTIENFAQLFYGFEPLQIIDYKAIVGDASDNFVGIKGVGKKTAIKLLNQYKTLDNIYTNLSKLTSKEQELFIKNKQDAYLCYQLAKIVTNLFVDKNIMLFTKKTTNNAQLVKIFNKLKLKIY